MRLQESGSQEACLFPVTQAAQIMSAMQDYRASPAFAMVVSVIGKPHAVARYNQFFVDS